MILGVSGPGCYSPGKESVRVQLLDFFGTTVYYFLIDTSITLANMVSHPTAALRMTQVTADSSRPQRSRTSALCSPFLTESSSSDSRPRRSVQSLSLFRFPLVMCRTRVEPSADSGMCRKRQRAFSSLPPLPPRPCPKQQSLPSAQDRQTRRVSSSPCRSRLEIGSCYQVGEEAPSSSARRYVTPSLLLRPSGHRRLTDLQEYHLFKDSEILAKINE